MPTNGNKVKFQYIGTTTPGSYDSDTIYFDNKTKKNSSWKLDNI